MAANHPALPDFMAVLRDLERKAAEVPFGNILVRLRGITQNGKLVRIEQIGDITVEKKSFQPDD